MKLKYLVGFFTLLAPAALYAAPPSPLQCLDQLRFSYEFNYTPPNSKQRLDAKLTKEASELKFVLFSGQGEKYSVNLYRGQISIDSFDSLESDAAKTIHSGSAGCSKPLFESDFELSSGESANFAKKRELLLGLMNAAESQYAKEANLAYANLKCTETLLRAYLEDCKAVSAPKEVKEEARP